MTMFDPNELNGSGPSAPRRESGRDGETIWTPRPYSDVEDILHDIPRARDDDPPLRDWWIDDEDED
jgi:hypothetical protein